MVNPTQPLVQASALDALLNIHAAAKSGYDDLENWWTGKQKVILTDRLKQFLASLNPANVEFADNYCEVIVAAVSDRLNVTGFTVPGEAPGVGTTPGERIPGPLAQFAVDTWQQNRSDALQLKVHDAALALGDAFVLVEWDAALARPCFYYNDPRAVRIHYDPMHSDRAEFATKAWDIKLERGLATRLNVYRPNEITRWIRNGEVAGGTWRPFADDEYGAVIDWTMPDGTPIGIPIVHFANGQRGATQYGRSELLPAIPLQRVVNKALHDGIRNSDSQGWPQRYATGVVSSTANINADPGSLWEVEEKEARFGQLDPASPQGVIDWLNKVQEDIATITRTPQHMFRVTGGYPSGEALKTAEAPLVKKVERRQVQFGNGWEDVMALAARLAIANGALPAQEIPDTGYSCQWDAAETRPGELDHILAVNAKQGVSTKQRLREYGYSDEEIERMEEERANEPDLAAEALAKALDGGNGAFGGQGQP